MKQFSYSVPVRIGILILQIGGILGLLLSTGMAILLFWVTGTVEAPSTSDLFNDPRITLLCVGLWALIIGWTASLGLINTLPTIWLEETGITISAFIFFKIHIPWSEIIDLNLGIVRWGHDLVRARRISIIHRIYGLLYTHTFYPSFIIRKDINDRDKLIAEIQRKAIRILS